MVYYVYVLDNPKYVIFESARKPCNFPLPATAADRSKNGSGTFGEFCEFARGDSGGCHKSGIGWLISGGRCGRAAGVLR
jgi:hypothetical protein